MLDDSSKQADLMRFHVRPNLLPREKPYNMKINQSSKYSDKEIVEGILAGNHQITSFFFCNECKGLFYYIYSQITNYRYEPNEIANDVLLYLSEKDWYKLRMFDFRSKLVTWLSVVAIRYYRKKMAGVIDMQSIETLIRQTDHCDVPMDSLESHMDIHNGLLKMPNSRYRMVIQQLDLYEVKPEKLAKEMNITTANLYNIHRRALQQLKVVMLGKEVFNGLYK